MKKRKFKTVGFFDSSALRGKKIGNPYMKRIYNVLLQNLNYRESWWQFIFEGQLGGLVLPHNDGKNEIHIRFYNDHIFAEYEIGRAYIAHFLGPRYNANNFLYDTVKLYLNKDELFYLSEKLHHQNYFSDEKEMIIWDHLQDGNPFYKDVHSRYGFLTYLGINRLMAKLPSLGWRSVATVIIALPTVLCMGWFSFLPSLIGGAAFFLLVSKLLPAKGSP